MYHYLTVINVAITLVRLAMQIVAASGATLHKFAEWFVMTPLPGVPCADVQRCGSVSGKFSHGESVGHW